MLQQCVLRWQAQALAQSFYAWQDAAQQQRYLRERLLTSIGKGSNHDRKLTCSDMRAVQELDLMLLSGWHAVV